LNLFVSQLELEQCAKFFGLKNVGYLPHCVADDYLQGPASARKKALFNLAWSGKQNLIRKGIPELLHAVHLLKNREQQVELYLAGLEGDGSGYLMEVIQQLQLENNVHYLGALNREEKIRLLREIEIYVQPSHYEGFGLAVLESMGCGACVIVRDVGAVKEVVGDCGLYLASFDTKELADVIERVLHDDSLRHQLQNEGMQRARNLFAFEKKLERLRGFLKALGIPDSHKDSLRCYTTAKSVGHKESMS
jgi:glycosyltransferase involved in cell wall biosynthesis